MYFNPSVKAAHVLRIFPTLATALLVISVFLLNIPSAHADDDSLISLAPVNPEFSQYIIDQQAKAKLAISEPSYGYRPPLMDLSHLDRIPLNRSMYQGPVSAPAAFDWRTQGKVTPVKDQRPCATCWTFANIAVMESRVLISAGGDPNTLDYSEQSLNTCVDPSWVYLVGHRCSGGSYGGQLFHSPGHPEQGWGQAGELPAIQYQHHRLGSL